MPVRGNMFTEEREAVRGLVAVDGRLFPLRSVRLEARVAGGMAVTTLFQEYTNPYAEPLDIIYALPLPADGAVTGYTIRLGERIVRGVIEVREKATARYREALIEGRTAGLLQQERSDTFTQSLGCLPPGVPVGIEIDVIHPCALRRSEREDGREWEYRFPTVLGVRYEGEPGRVSDAAALEAPRADEKGVPVRLAAMIALLDGPPERLSPRWPDGAVDVSLDGRASLAVFGHARLDRDLVLRWNASEAEVGATIVEGSGLPGDTGRYALLTLTPPAVAGPTFAREVTFLLDVSGSMSGTPLAHSKKIVHAMLDTLTPRDRFEILAFSSSTQDLTGGFVATTEPAVRAARAALDALRAGGGTEMTSAIDRALEACNEESQRQVVLVTDGYIGFESEIVGRVQNRTAKASRLHLVGVGSAPNRALTRGASRAGRGLEVLVGPNDLAEDAAARLVSATVQPILTQVRVTGSAVRRVAPRLPHDVFADQAALVFFELRDEGGSVEVTGRLAGQDATWVRRFEMGPRARSGPDRDLLDREASSQAADTSVRTLPLGACLGREWVEDCEEELAVVDKSRTDAILTRIETIGLRHRIVTRRTSLVAISEDPTVDPKDPRRRERLAVELPLGVSAEGVGLGAANLMAPEAALLFRIAASATKEQLKPRVREFLLGDRELIGSPDGRRRPPLKGRILRFEGELLIVEVEAPSSGLTVPAPGSSIDILWDGGSRSTGSLDETLSTRPGLHPKGLMVRIALKLDHPPESRRPILFSWMDSETDVFIELVSASGPSPWPGPGSGTSTSGTSA